VLNELISFQTVVLHTYFLTVGSVSLHGHSFCYA